jgi:predicted LPLAT superfamily acyltransferase
MSEPAWSARRERGNAGLVRLMIRLSLKFGWGTGQLLVYPIALYFFLFARLARAASRGFLARVLSRPPNAADVLRHIFSYSCVLFDRIFLLSDRTDGFIIEAAGLADVTRALAQSRGCLLFGAHLGSFEALRSFRRQSPVAVKVLMYRGNNGAYTDLVEALDPSLAQDIIDIGQPDSMLHVRESLERGEMVGILADRAPGGDRMLAVPFLGAPALFPTGPLRLAAALGAPVVLFFGIRTAPRRYTIYFEHFADCVALDQGDRTAQTALWLQRYTSRLEHYCRRYPFNWFNFYDFWDHHPQPSPAPQSPLRRCAVVSQPPLDRGSELSVADR